MIDVKEAIRIAKDKANEMLDGRAASIEEIERDFYKDRDVWSITLGFPRELSEVALINRLVSDDRSYKRFLIDAQTGEFLAMKIRELAMQ